MQRKPIILSAVHGLQLAGVQLCWTCTGEAALCHNSPLRSKVDLRGARGGGDGAADPFHARDLFFFFPYPAYTK